MDIGLRSLLHRNRYPCILLDSRDCRLISRRNAILHPQRSTRISFKDFYMPTVPAETIPIKVVSLSTSNSAGIARQRRGAGIASKSQFSPSTTAEAFPEMTDGRDLKHQLQGKERHVVRKDSESDHGVDNRREEFDHFVKLILKSWRKQNYDEGFRLLKCMVSTGHVPDVSLCTKLINGFSSSSHPSADPIFKAQEVMKILEKHGLQDTFAYNSLLVVVCKKTKDSSAKHVMESCIAVLEQMQAHGCFPDLVTYNILIGTLRDKGRLDLAMELLDHMLQVNQCQPSFRTYFIFIKASLMGTHDNENCEGNGGGITRVIKLLQEMAAKGLQLDNDTYNCILKAMFDHRLVDQAWQLMRTLSNHQTSGTSSSSSGFKPILAPGVISYNILLTGLLNMRRWEDAEKLVLEMVSTEQCGTNETCHSIAINSFCKHGMVDKAIKVLDDMMARGLKPDTHIYNSIVSAYCKQSSTKLAITFIEHLHSRGYVPDIVVYNTILSSLHKNERAFPSLEVLDRLEKMGCLPNTTSSYNAFIGGFWFYGNRTKAMKMLSQMVDKGIHPDVDTYNTLIVCLCRDGMVHHAIQLMADMEDTWGYIPTVTTYNIIIDGLCRAHHIDAAVDILEEMTERRCTPNERTYIMLVECLAHAGYVEEATNMSTALLSCNAVSRNQIRRLENIYSLQIQTLI